MFNLKQIAPATFEVPMVGNMRVPGLVIATEQLMREMEFERPLEQVKNVAHLPGIVRYSIAMPDIHWGYGFPIGGVAAMQEEGGVISPGGVGYDINCGVRLALIPEPFDKLAEAHKEELLKSIFQLVPSGIGQGHTNEMGLSEEDYQKLIEQGAKWSIEQGYGFEKDLDHMESRGCIEGGSVSSLSSHAKNRGKKQLGSIGSGNHFVEIGEVDTIYLPEIAKEWGVEEKQTYVMIHSGSRGFGHQVCQDTLNEFIQAGFAKNLPDKQLVCAPIQSDLGKKYFQNMAAAANFAFNNRQQILHAVRKGFQKVLNVRPEDIQLLYDVCHNIAKFETHEVDGVKKRLCVHRKGATRAFGPHSEELAPIFQNTGQPVLVPGDMGRASHLLAGMGNPLTWCSCCHGAGRAKSRIQSKKAWQGKDLVKHMQNQGVSVMATSNRTIAEEMPDAYKDVDSVVKAVQEAQLAKMVAKLRPHLVIKG